MAYFDGGFSARPFVLRLWTTQGGQSQAGNYTDVSWALEIVKTGSYDSYDFGSYPWSATIDGQTFSGATGYDFRGVGAITIGSGSKRVYHDANGNATIYSSAAFSGNSTIGNASTGGYLGLSRIAKVPGAPLITGTVGGTVLGAKNPTTTSMDVVFSGTTDGGSTITGWEIQYAEDVAFTVNAKAWPSSGTSTITGLLPGKTYYFRARGRNAVGWGAYSTTVSAKTLTALYVSDGTNWLPAELYVSDGTTWTSVTLAISDGTSWQDPLPV